MIDFGDSQHNPLVYELALVIMYLMTNCTEIHPNLVSGHYFLKYDENQVASYSEC